MSISIYRVSMSFVQSSDDSLVTFTGEVITGMDGPAFAEKPVSTAEMTTRKTDFQQKLAISRNGGKTEVAEKNTSRRNLIAGLRQNANFVQMIASTDLPLLLASGFKATNTNRTSGPLTKPVIADVDNFQSTMLMVAAEVDSRSRAQEARYRVPGSPTYQSGGIHTKPTRVLYEGLVPGTMYELQLRSVGGTTGYSDWSDPVTHMAT